MGYIHCCGTLHKTKTYKVVPQGGFVLCELDYLKKCPVCGHSIVRKVNQKARVFFNQMQKFILYEKVPQVYKKCGKFYLNYNEYGVKKRCYSNLSTLKIGLCENKSLNNIQSF